MTESLTTADKVLLELQEMGLELDVLETGFGSTHVYNDVITLNFREDLSDVCTFHETKVDGEPLPTLLWPDVLHSLDEPSCLIYLEETLMFKTIKRANLTVYVSRADIMRCLRRMLS